MKDKKSSPEPLEPFRQVDGHSALTQEQLLLREYERREADLHKYQQREIVKVNHDSPLDFPPHLIPAGKEYRWVRLSIFNEPDYARTDEIQRDQWTAVPADRHPDRAMRDLIGREKAASNYITYGGLILCERSKELCERSRLAFASSNDQLMRSMEGHEDNQGIKRHSSTGRGSMVPW